MNEKLIRSKNDYNKKIRMKIFLYSSLSALTVVILFYLYLSFYYNHKFYNNTVINSVSTSNMTANEAEDAIDPEVKTYVLKLEGRNGVQDQLYGVDLDLHTVFDGNISDLLVQQKGFAWPIFLFKSRELKINSILEYDESLLEKCFNELKYFDKANIVEPVNAHLSEYGNNGYEIVPEDLGAKIDKEILYKAIQKAVMSLEPSLSLEDIGCYEEPIINSQYPKLVETLDEMNKLAGTEITYEFGEDKEILDGNLISKWISVDEDYTVKLDVNGVKEYVDYIGKTYNSFGRVRTFKTSYGDVLQIAGGDYGWWLDRNTEVSELTGLIMNGEQLVREPSYFQTAWQYGQDDIGDTYVEVNLTAQHLFFYKDGILILESDFVSGNISKKYGTPIGTYPIQYKENDATLNGEDYSTPVKYWMPFNRNIGFHDAPWRHNKFGEDIYLTNGSHGCINMPPAMAKKMFENISRGVAVVVYKLKGTENYDLKKDAIQKVHK